MKPSKSKLEITGANIAKLDPKSSKFLGKLIEEVNLFAESSKPVFLVFDPLKADLRLARKKTNSLRVAVLMEPPVVIPSNGVSANFKDFDLVFELGRLRGNVTGRHVSLPWPQDLDICEDFFSENRKSELVVINGNKFSFVPGELYSLRRKLIRNEVSNIDLYGTGWRERVWITLEAIAKSAIFAILNKRFSFHALAGFRLSSPRNFLGQPSDKLKTISKYEFSLVIENWQGCFTEKIFDALKAGSFPIYVGPSLEKMGIPEGFALQASPDFTELTKVIRSPGEKLDTHKRKEIYSWLSREGNPHRYDNVVAEMVRHIRSAYQP